MLVYYIDSDILKNKQTNNITHIFKDFFQWLFKLSNVISCVTHVIEFYCGVLYWRELIFLTSIKPIICVCFNLCRVPFRKISSLILKTTNDGVLTLHLLNDQHKLLKKYKLFFEKYTIQSTICYPTLSAKDFSCSKIIWKCIKGAEPELGCPRKLKAFLHSTSSKMQRSVKLPKLALSELTEVPIRT